MNVARLFLLPVLVAAAQAGATAKSCEDLESLDVPGGRVTLAASVTPNPEWRLPPSLYTGPDAPPGWLMSTRVPFCRVALTLGKESRVEVWMPSREARNWNGRFLGVGNAGLSGGIHYPAMAEALGSGFATASTDTGHASDGFFDTGWIEGFPERVLDFGHRAHHAMAVAAKRVISAYYETPAKKSYFDGCSFGGWQGLTEAQKYPGDYDGIIAGAPANNFVKLQARSIMEQQMSAKEPRGNLSGELGKVLVHAAVAKCDAMDGITDGIINDPRACPFDPAEIQCKKGETKGCLTPAEVKRAKWTYGPSKSPGGLALYPGPAYGATPSLPLPGIDPRHPRDTAIYLMLQQRPDWTVTTFDPDKHIPPLEARFDADLGATNPDLSAFAARGGKLLIYHGWADPLISPFNSIDYFERVSSTLGAGRTNTFMRLYMAPGMAHCSGGAGPDQFDAIDAVVKWVEESEAPAHLIATHSSVSAPLVAEGGKVDRTRPLCPYPQVAKYKGGGSTDDAASFTCAVP